MRKRVKKKWVKSGRLVGKTVGNMWKKSEKSGRRVGKLWVNCGGKSR